MFLATRGVPEPLIVFLVLAGGTLAAGGAHSINNYLDRDVDSMMRRTSHRPVVEGRISPHQALGFGIILNVIAFAILVYFVNPISALITLSGTLFYVFIYTLALKKRTPQNIVIGGAAGAVPPVVGWAAVTGSIDLPALYLFAIIFFWTPPHFWALSLLIKDDYARAGIPMLPECKSWHSNATGSNQRGPNQAINTALHFHINCFNHNVLHDPGCRVVLSCDISFIGNIVCILCLQVTKASWNRGCPQRISLFTSLSGSSIRFYCHRCIYTCITLGNIWPVWP